MKNKPQKHQVRTSVRVGALAALFCAIAVAIFFSDSKDNTSRVVASQTNEISDVVSNGPIVFTNLQVVPSFGR